MISNKCLGGIKSQYSTIPPAFESYAQSEPASPKSDAGREAVRLLILDNYDSFTFNLAQAFAVLGCRVEVIRSDKLTPEEFGDLQIDALVISPGPGNPQATGNCKLAYDFFRNTHAILGVCLGHQLIAEIHGSVIQKSKSPRHGKADPIQHTQTDLFNGIEQGMYAARYHSLHASLLPGNLKSLARLSGSLDDAEICMAFRVEGEASWGIQFHPESFLCPEGPKILDNFCRFARELRTANSREQ